MFFVDTVEVETGGPELARLTGASYLVPAGARVAFARVPVRDGDGVGIDPGSGLTLRAMATPGHTPHHTAYVLREYGAAVAAFTGGSLLIGTVGRPDLVEPRLTESLARAQHASAHRLVAELPEDTAVLPTHGFGSFCASTRARGDSTTIGKEKSGNEALVRDVDTFVAELLAGLDDIAAYYTHMSPVNAAGPAPVDLTPPAVADAAEIADSGYLDGSVHIPIHTLPQRLAEVPPGEVWVHCAGGTRAAIAASFLDAVGRDVVAVDDAYANAGAAGLPLREA